jgi:hypothetical protein
LNQFITDALSGSLGWRSPDRDPDENAGGGTRAVPVGRFDSRNVTGRSADSRPRLPTAVFVANAIIVALAAVVATLSLSSTAPASNEGEERETRAGVQQACFAGRLSSCVLWP